MTQNNKLKLYLAHPISTRGEFEDSKRVANEIRKLNCDVYVASENDAINDKSNEPTVLDIYDGDIDEIVEADIIVVNVTGGHADGTISEVGFSSGFNHLMYLLGERLPKDLFDQVLDYLGLEDKLIIGYTSNARMLQPQFHEGVPSASANHLVLGHVEKWGEFVGSEEDMLNKLKGLKGKNK